jgi:hypothetical protein
LGGTAGIKKVICMKRKEEKFLKKGLDKLFAKQPDGQISWLPFTSSRVRGEVTFDRRHGCRRLVRRGATIGARSGNK